MRVSRGSGKIPDCEDNWAVGRERGIGGEGGGGKKKKERNKEEKEKKREREREREEKLMIYWMGGGLVLEDGRGVGGKRRSD